MLHGYSCPLSKFSTQTHGYEYHANEYHYQGVRWYSLHRNGPTVPPIDLVQNQGGRNFPCERKINTKFLPPKVFVDLCEISKSLPRKTTEIEHSFHNSVFIWFHKKTFGTRFSPKRQPFSCVILFWIMVTSAWVWSLFLQGAEVHVLTNPEIGFDNSRDPGILLGIIIFV
jgi:hypothetical protein